MVLTSKQSYTFKAHDEVSILTLDGRRAYKLCYVERWHGQYRGWLPLLQAVKMAFDTSFGAKLTLITPLRRYLRISSNPSSRSRYAARAEASMTITVLPHESGDRAPGLDGHVPQKLLGHLKGIR